MEKGEIQRLNKSYIDSISSWSSADQLINEWENGAKITASKVGNSIGSVLVNDKTLNYDGEDYEKVMLSTRQALNYLASGKNDDAMVEMKKTWEREELIKQLHDKDIQESEEEAKSKGYTIKSEDLKGYPVSTLNSPEVLGLKNGYQSAFSQYLSGYLSEATGDYGNAAAGYRAAIELQPSLESLKKHLAELDSRINSLQAPKTIAEQNTNNVTTAKKSKLKKSKSAIKSKVEKEKLLVEQAAPIIQETPQIYSDVLIVVENGLAPIKTGITIPLPIPKAGIVPISFPTLEADPISNIRAISVTLPDNSISSLEQITNIDAMARRSLKDNLPKIMVRAAIRAAIKGGSQAAVYRQSAIAGIALNILNVVTERPDERIWRLLPSDITITRVRLPEGSHSLKLNTTTGTRTINVTVSGKYCVIPVRVIGNSTYVM